MPEGHWLSVIVTIEMAITAAATVSVKTRSCGYNSLIFWNIYITLRRYICVVGREQLMLTFRRTKALLLHLVCCSGSAGCGW